MSHPLIIVGSASLQSEISQWRSHWEEQGFTVINYPKPIPLEGFMEAYPDVHIQFFKDILESQVVFVMNEDKNGLSGYIWAETFAELAYAVSNNLLNSAHKRIILRKMPDKKVQCADEIELWLKLGWIELLS